MHNKEEPNEIWTKFFTHDKITIVLNNTNNKIMSVIEQLPEEVCNNDKYTNLREVTKEELLAFLVSHKQGDCPDKTF